ncbi:MAG: NAD-dependent DNA ligase LigA, partial [Chlorobi bacterium]|nr:NAD-dependent DNA ligase LigA [Chlorobiota bacterium]
NILNGIEQSKNVPFPRVLYAIGIRYVGETVAKKLALYFKSMDALMQACHEELTAVEEIGEKIAVSVIEYFARQEHIKMIKRLKEKGIQMEIREEEKPVVNKLDGKRFVVSGVFDNYSRDEIKRLIEIYGGKNVSSVSSKTDYVLAGHNMGPGKKQKAEELGIPIISEEDFERMIGGNE